MEFQVLGPDNVKQYIEYLKTAMTKEPEMMTTDIVDEEGLLERVRDPFSLKTTSVLAIENGRVAGVSPSGNSARVIWRVGERL